MAKIACGKHILEVLYEDNHIIVVAKPPNAPVQKDDSGDMDMQNAIKAYIKRKYRKTGDVYLGIVHRLDRPVGGVMVFARTSKAAARLSASIVAGEVTKNYYAITQTKLPEVKGQLVNLLVKDDKTGTSRVVDKQTAESKEAILNYELKEVRTGLNLYNITLLTGRHHQIRAQLANAGAPIWGDQRYAFKIYKPGQQIALFAHTLAFVHPVKKELMSFSSEFAETYPWSLFKKEKAQ